MHVLPTTAELLDHRAKGKEELISQEFGVHQELPTAVFVMPHMVFPAPAMDSAVIYSFCEWRQPRQAK